MNHKYNLLALTLVIFSVAAFAQKAPEIPSGIIIKVRTIETLSSEDARVGDTFHATLEEPIIVSDKEIYPRGADVSGRVVDVHRSGRLSEPGELDLVLRTVTSGDRTSSLRVEPLVMKGQSHTKSNATKIGGGAALGAVIGAIAGGGKGAAIGTGVGAAAGTGAAAATGKKEVEVLPETVLSFTTSTSVAVNGENASTTPPASAATSTSTTTSTDDSGSLFTLRDRRVLRTCLAEHASELPPGTMQKSDLPSGQERQLHRDSSVPSDISGKLQSLPLACDSQLPKLSHNQERVIYSRRILLIDSNNRILDIFDLDETQ